MGLLIPPGQAASPGNKTGRELKGLCLEIGYKSSNTRPLALQKWQRGSSKKALQREEAPGHGGDGGEGAARHTQQDSKEGKKGAAACSKAQCILLPKPYPKNDRKESKKTSVLLWENWKGASSRQEISTAFGKTKNQIIREEGPQSR